MVKFIGEDGFYPKWAQGEGRWVHQRVLMPFLFPPLSVPKQLLWVPPKSSFLGLKKVSPRVEAYRASEELSQIPFRCARCGWEGTGRKLRCFGKPSYWALECPECLKPVEPDLRVLDAEVIIEQWDRLGRPVLEDPHAGLELESTPPINDLQHWIDSFQPMASELAYVGQQLWQNFASFIKAARPKHGAGRDLQK
jgi:hypothetical protein